MSLSVGEREAYLDALGEEQRRFLTERMTRGRRTVFANAMARAKGFHIPDDTEPEAIEMLLDDWIYTGYVDAGAVTAELRCECGRALRYQHHVTNKSTGETLKFGIEHLKEHLGIDAAVVAAIKSGFDAIDYELDDMLLKSRGGWTPEPGLLDVSPLPADVSKQLELGLPLLERQIRRLRQLRRNAALPVRAKPAAAVRPPVPAAARQEWETKPGKPAIGDLFSWFEETEPERAPAATGNESGPSAEPVDKLPERLKPAVDRFLREGAVSARVACELLIREHSAPDGRFSTGKPYLYPALCSYIENTHPDAMIETSSHEDRVYRLTK